MQFFMVPLLLGCFLMLFETFGQSASENNGIDKSLLQKSPYNRHDREIALEGLKCAILNKCPIIKVCINSSKQQGHQSQIIFASHTRCRGDWM
jgi:hypothetical protein